MRKATLLLLALSLVLGFSGCGHEDDPDGTMEFYKLDGERTDTFYIEPFRLTFEYLDGIAPYYVIVNTKGLMRYEAFSIRGFDEYQEGWRYKVILTISHYSPVAPMPDAIPYYEFKLVEILDKKEVFKRIEP